MKSIYITSVDRTLVRPHYPGDRQTATATGEKVGYFKPLSFQPWRIGDKLADEDAAFVKEG